MRHDIAFIALLTAGVLAATPAAQAGPEPGITTYHVGYDNAEFVGYGTYTGLANPNFQRLTFLLSHTFSENALNNHFHSIGAYSYSGDPLNPSPGFSGNNRVPEPYQADDGLALLPGSGPFAGKLVSGLGPVALPEDVVEEEYGNLTIAPIDELFQYDGRPDPDGEFAQHPGHYLLNASNGAYKQSVADVTVGMKLVAISPGLLIEDESGTQLFSGVNDVLTIGSGADWTFNPVFAVDATVASGSKYEATFVLQDLSLTPRFGDSAEFTFSFIAVPEPGAALLGLVALASFGVWRR
ncbi:hypothetical protein Pla108_20090 [Botrimarina colliarenosi]|uniref:PEP-CTERM protein-sorting domain-containing protein n=1 Tax=Botrimarina colliarenosi TaxID=2528001 RepID=A0A5C6AEK4_9BACT|nr:all3515 family Zur-repressed PEP-CTERM protein [Botrimarina colliarenosi]TWT97856.1 hypothetical protein Pla108_20090 [Botrimarina colliarenosi]